MGETKLVCSISLELQISFFCENRDALAELLFFFLKFYFILKLSLWSMLGAYK